MGYHVMEDDNYSILDYKFQNRDIVVNSDFCSVLVCNDYWDRLVGLVRSLL